MAELYLGTVYDTNSQGTRITFDGMDEPTTKRYKRISNGVSLSVGDRVVAAKMSGTYIILGKIV